MTGSSFPTVIIGRACKISTTFKLRSRNFETSKLILVDMFECIYFVKSHLYVSVKGYDYFRSGLERNKIKIPIITPVDLTPGSWGHQPVAGEKIRIWKGCGGGDDVTGSDG